MAESLKGKAISGVIWSSIERFSAQGIQFILSIILARLVLPADYGLIAMLGIFLAIAQTFIDSGFSNALIQKQDRTETDFSTAFYFNVIIGLIVYLLLYFCSPCIASFYDEPKLNDITKIVGLNLIINSFSVVQQAKLTIALNFKCQAVASFISIIISGTIGIYLAYNGYGVWSLVFQTLLNNFLKTLLLWIFTKWMPKLIFSWKSFKNLFHFGSKLLLSGLLHTIYMNLYSLVIGKKFSPADLGYFNRAYTLTNFPSDNFSEVFRRAIYPIQCSIQNDDEKLKYSFLQYLRMSAYLIFPLMIGLLVLAKPLVLLILTDKWLPMVPLLQIMCIAYMWTPIMSIDSTIVNVKGRSDFFLKAEIIKKIAAIIILLLTIPFGIRTMCYGLIVYSFCDICIMSRYTYMVIHVSLMEQVKSLLPILILNIVMGVVVYLIILFVDQNILKMILGISFGFLFYIFFSYVFKYKELEFIFSIIKSK